MTVDATRTSLGTGRILPDDTVLSDRYRIKRLIGVGGMGMVYLARDEHLELDVALKVLRSGGAADEMRLERFRSELVLARQISHRNVVRIHDIGQSGELYFITMDYVEGQSLKQILELEGALDAGRATSIAADLADALAEAHHAEVVHRDVKPANVLISEDRACLTDFGIARSIHADGLTRVGEVVGTLDYLSPEQAKGQSVDGRADIYALGLLLYEMLTGARPFTGETAEEVLAQRTLAEPRDLTSKNDAVPAWLRPIIERCLAVDPADRYQSAARLAADLRAGRAGREWQKPLRRAGLAAVALLVAAMAWMLWPGRDPVVPAGDVAAASGPIAVLPFEVAVTSGDLASISQGLAELLVEQLSSGAGVQVIASQRVNATLRDLKLTTGNLPASDEALLGDLLDAEYLVAGRLQQINDNFHVEARLRRASSGEVVYRASQNASDVAAIFAAIRPLAGELLANLDVDADVTSPVASVDPEALGAFATGVDRLSKGNAVDAVGPLQSAVRVAPEFVLAWDRLAQALSMLGRDREAQAAADSAVAALDGGGGRFGAIVRARRAALGGDLDAAALTLEDLLSASPGDNEVRFMLAEIYGDAGRLQDAEAMLKAVVAGSPDHPQAWYLMGKYAILRGDSRRAVDDYLVKALVIQNRLENDQGRADVLNALGIAHSDLGDEEAATDYYRQALALRRGIGDERGVAAVLANLARINLRNGRYDEAREELISARDELRTIGDRWTVANLENELGFLEEQRGRFQAALEHYRESLRLRDDLGDLRALAESYNNIGYIYYLLGEYDNAAIFNDRSLETYRETGNREGIMLASQIKGILNTALGRYDDALKALLETLTISRELGDAHAEAATEGYIGNARRLEGQYAAADASFGSATQKLDSLGDARGLAEFVLRDAELSLDTGLWRQAADSIVRARELLSQDGNAAALALLYRIEGEYLDSTGDADAAAERFAAALDEALRTGEQVSILLARLAGAGRLEASERVAELRAIADASMRLRHGELLYESALALAGAYHARGQHEDGERVLTEILDSRPVAAGYHREYRLQALLADVSESLGRTEAAANARLAAANAVERLMAAQSGEQRNAFVQMEPVRRIRRVQGD